MATDGPDTNDEYDTRQEPTLLFGILDLPNKHSQKQFTEETSQVSIGSPASEDLLTRKQKHTREEPSKQSSQYDSSEEYSPEKKSKKKRKKNSSILKVNQLTKSKVSQGNISQTIEKLEKELKEYEEQLENLHAPENLNENAKSNWIKKEKNKISSQISRHNKAKKDLQNAINSKKLFEEKEELAAKVKELAEANADLTDKLATITTLPLDDKSSVDKPEFESLKTAKSELEVECLALKLKNAESKGIIDALTRSNTKDVADLEKQTERLSSQNATLKEQNTDLLNRLTSYLTSKEAAEVVLQTEKVALAGQCQLLTNYYNQLNEASSKKIRQHEKIKEELKVQITELSKERAYLKTCLDDSDKALEKMEYERYDLIQEVNELQQQLDYAEYYLREPSYESSRNLSSKTSKHR